MPQHQYRTKRHPPRMVDHVFASGMSLAMAVWSIYVGLLSVIQGVTPFTPSKALAGLNSVLISSIGLFLIIGSISIILGLMSNDDDLHKAWATERSGIVIAGTGWLGFMTVTLWNAPGVTIFWTLALFLQIGMGARYWGTTVDEKNLRSAIFEMHHIEACREQLRREDWA